MIGCGYGQIVRQVNKKYLSFGIDYDIDALRVGKQSFDINLVQADAYFLCFADKSFETMMLRESAHHLNMNKMLPELKLVASKEIVIFDPNITVFTVGTQVD